MRALLEGADVRRLLDAAPACPSNFGTQHANDEKVGKFEDV